MHLKCAIGQRKYGLVQKFVPEPAVEAIDKGIRAGLPGAVWPRPIRASYDQVLIATMLVNSVPLSPTTASVFPAGRSDSQHRKRPARPKEISDEQRRSRVSSLAHASAAPDKVIFISYGPSGHILARAGYAGGGGWGSRSQSVSACVQAVEPVVQQGYVYRISKAPNRVGLEVGDCIWTSAAKEASMGLRRLREPRGLTRGFLG